MYYFAYHGEPISDSHWAPLQRFFAKNKIDHDVLNMTGRAFPDEGAVISCTVRTEEVLREAGAKAKNIQLQHNLSGLRGNPLNTSKADLIILAGRRVSDLYDLEVDGERVVIGGYPKWDIISNERGCCDQRRDHLSRELMIDPGIPWVCFYPSAPNLDVREGNHHYALWLSQRVEEQLGPHEFFFINHGNNKHHADAAQKVHDFRALTRGYPHLHLIDGGGALGYVSSCNLFISDIASATFSAIALAKPVVFLPIKLAGRLAARVAEFQQGPTIDQIDDLGSFIEGYQTPPALLELLASAIENDDDNNCQRVTEIITRWSES